METDEEQIQAVLEALDQSIQRSIKTPISARSTMRSTLKRLGEQSERLLRTEHNINDASYHARDGRDKTQELRMLNKGLFRSCRSVSKVSDESKDTKFLEQLRRRRAENEAVRDEYRAIKQLIPDEHDESNDYKDLSSADGDRIEELQLIVQELTDGAQNISAIVDRQLNSIDRSAYKVSILPH